MSLLEDLYYGKFCPNEQVCLNDPEYVQNSQLISERMHILQAKLSPEDFTVLEEIMDLNSLLISISSASAYTLGFKTGAAMLIEVLEHKTEPIQTNEKLIFEQIKWGRREL
ncbi:DUF6809 family protein [Paenibacillus sp. FSL R7-0337]|uniref:DUF6809 family protein n=1 Tax=Paenibacillus sp. FSL R7-0337 TaxID=1926588 RepID=UPI00096E867E|nr:DUF6809 family protein [Paenibacillus sp. FSL R7-0337]OMF89473.1 hypothetical protein BK147_25070 [Paenibacillus sp. FSL R7-0337]